MFHNARKQLRLIGFFPIILSFPILMCAGVARAQEWRGRDFSAQESGSETRRQSIETCGEADATESRGDRTKV
jgi:hypothetical protein